MATLVTRSGKGSPLTHAEVDANFTNLNTDKLELSGGTMTGNLSFGDNDKAIFGAGSDLQIYHSGAASFISEAGTGNLFIEGSSEINFRNTAQTAYLMRLTDGGNVRLYHAGAQKLATTSTGIDVTGTITADGLTVEGSDFVLANFERTAVSGGIAVQLTNGDDNAWQIAAGGDETYALRYLASGGSAVKYFEAASNGDISFYEDTGVTPKFFWDASAESLGIGTTSPASFFSGGNQLVVGDGSGAQGLTIYAESTNHGQILFADGTTGNAAYRGILRYDHVTDSMQIMTTGATERMRIDSSGRVLIGRTSSSLGGGNGATLQIGSGSNAAGMTIHSNTTSTGDIQFADGTSGNASYRGLVRYDHSADYMSFWSSASERMRIDSSGNVGIGRTSSAYGAQLSVQGGIETHSNQLNIAAGTSGVTPFEFVNRIGGGFDFYVNNATNLAARIDSSGNTIIKAGKELRVNRPDDATYGAISHGASGTGIVYNDLNGDGHHWQFAGSEKMRIDSSGNLLVGTTDSTPSTNTTGSGIALSSTGTVEVARDGNHAIRLNRMSSDGDIAVFRKDGTTVGSIGSRSGSQLYIEGEDGGIQLYQNGIRPNRNGALSDATQSIGTAGYRFTDLYLSGGVYLGGTGSANKLDDYEEGTWTPIYQNLSADPSLTYSEQTGYYTKIGDTVHLWFRVIAGTVTTQGTGALLVGGFPYIVKSSTSNYSSINVAYSNSWTTAPQGGHTEPNSYYAYLKYPDANGNLVNNLANITAGDDLIAQITYKTS